MTDETHVALCSGGMDSAVATHIAVRWGPADIVVHLDTGTGIDDNEAYVREFAREINAQPWTLGTHEDYEEIVAEPAAPVTVGVAASGRRRSYLMPKPPATATTPSGCGPWRPISTPTTNRDAGRGAHCPMPNGVPSASTTDKSRCVRTAVWHRR